MILKYKTKRRRFIKIFSVLVLLFTLFSIWNFFQSGFSTLSFISLLFQLVLWFGFLYFQAGRYDDKKIMAQFGWPRIDYKDITSVNYKWGDIIIKSKNRQIGINKAVVDEDSLKKFDVHLKKHSPQSLDLNYDM